MREPRPIAGARAPLFERLVDDDPLSLHELAPLRILNHEALMASVARELSRLLNTRSPHPERLLRAGQACVLDYGVPDFSALAAASGGDRDGYAAVLTQLLTTFEPRLSHVKVVLDPEPTDPLRLRGAVSAQLRLGTVREPVSFPLLLRTGTGELTLGEAAAAAAAGAS